MKMVFVEYKNHMPYGITNGIMTWVAEIPTINVPEKQLVNGKWGYHCISERKTDSYLVKGHKCD